MSIKEFDKIFNIQTSIEEEKLKFVNRIENSVFDFFNAHLEFAECKTLFQNVCYQLGADPTPQLKKAYTNNFKSLHFKELSKGEFTTNLRILVALYQCSNNNKNHQRRITSFIHDALDRSSLNLGVRWTDGVFYPTGDEFLDKELIDNSMLLLTNFPNEKKDLQTALENYYSNSFNGVVTSCYLAIEGLGRRLLNNNKTLDNNQIELLKLLQFSSYWDKIFLNYLKYAHEFSRHAGEKRHEIKPEEVEGFLYLTCLIIRAVIKSSHSQKLP